MPQILSWLLIIPVLGSAAAQPEESWPPDEPDTRGVNEGRLEVLDWPPPPGLFRIDNRLVIDADSARHGWVTIEQCHRRLDPVPRLEIRYDYRELRGLEITEAHGIGAHRVVDGRVELADIGRGAGLCVRLQARILNRAADGRLSLCQGPFYRGFLDGFYPMAMTERIEYPATWALLGAEPAAVFPPPRTPGHIEARAHFNGRLSLHLEFAPPAETAPHPR